MPIGQYVSQISSRLWNCGDRRNDREQYLTYTGNKIIRGLMVHEARIDSKQACKRNDGEFV